MKTLLLTILLFATTFPAYANHGNPNANFCEWLGNAANVVAQNRDNGIEEYDLIGKYLSESESYGEQSIVIPLIDRVYGIESELSPEQIAFTERQQCEIAFARH